MKPLLAVAAACAAISCSRTDHQPPVETASNEQKHVQVVKPLRGALFEDITTKSGIDFSMTSGAKPSNHILEVNGGGVALIDYDNDGLLDVFISNGATMDDPENGPGSRLYRNLGSMRFEDVTQKARINIKRWAMGATTGDFNGDGFDDLYICCYGPNILLRNNGDGTFTDVTAKAGVGDERWAASAAFGDVNNDGWLDLYVVNYLEFDHRNPPGSTQYKGVQVMGGPHGMVPQHDVLYLNNGDGTFQDVTAQAGCLPRQAAFGLNLVILDMDGDGWQDIVVANDSMPDFYFRNLGTAQKASSPASQPLLPRFEEIGVISGIASNADGANQASMGIAIGDVNGDSKPDKFTTVFSSDTNTLHQNVDGRFFEDRTQSYGLGVISRPFLGWACAFYDFDHDGDEDLMAFNGHVYPQATMASMDSDYLQPPLLFVREGRRYQRASSEIAGGWLDVAASDRAAAWGDLDNDGDIDVVFVELNGPVRVLENQTAQPGRPDWMLVELSDNRPDSHNHRGLGATLSLQLDNGSRMTRWLFTGGGYQSSSQHAAHFGFRQGLTPKSLTITWPDGHVQTIEKPSPGKLIVKRDQSSKHRD